MGSNWCKYAIPVAISLHHWSCNIQMNSPRSCHQTLYQLNSCDYETMNVQHCAHRDRATYSYLQAHCNKSLIMISNEIPQAEMSKDNATRILSLHNELSESKCIQIDGPKPTPCSMLYLFLNWALRLESIHSCKFKRATKYLCAAWKVHFIIFGHCVQMTDTCTQVRNQLRRQQQVLFPLGWWRMTRWQLLRCEQGLYKNHTLHDAHNKTLSLNGEILKYRCRN